MRLESSTAASYVQLQPSTASGSWTMTLPSSAGTANYVLSTDGSGNTSWVNLGGSGTALNLGTSASATNPQRPGQAGTGLFSATTNTVSIAANGSDVADFASTGLNLPGAAFRYQINGSNALWQDAVNYNLAVGPTGFPGTVSQSGGGNNGQLNTAIGPLALNANTTGASNTAIGYSALLVNTSGFQNTAVGAVALNANSTASGNTAIGYAALEFNTTGTKNTAVGLSALQTNTTGGYNAALGYDALYSNTTGQYNTAVGYAALFTGSTASGNTAVGEAALTNATGGSNTALGQGAGYDVTSGGQNIIIGNYATSGVGITTGSYNILIGQDLQKLTQAGSAQLDIGNLIFATGLSSGATLSSGSVGIGTVSPSYTLHVNGSVAGTSAYNNLSDVRFKKDIAPIAYGLDTVMKLRPVGFNWRDQAQEWQTKHQLGLIAQEVEAVVPEVVTTANDAMKTRSLAYGSLVPVLIKATQELKSGADRQTRDIADMRKQIAALAASRTGPAPAAPSAVPAVSAGGGADTDHFLLVVTSSLALLAFAGMGGMGILLLRMNAQIRQLSGKGKRGKKVSVPSFAPRYWGSLERKEATMTDDPHLSSITGTKLTPPC